MSPLGRSVYPAEIRGLVGQMRHRTAPSAWGFPVSQTWTDFERHCQRYRQARSVTLGGTTQGFLQPSHRSRAAPREICYLPNTVQGAGFQGLILSFLSSSHGFPPNYFIALLLYKKLYLICFLKYDYTSTPICKTIKMPVQYI